jgi:hypothetical protein
MSEEALSGMEDMGQWVAFVTGVRQQLLDAGWTQEVAELMTLEAFRLSVKQTPTVSSPQ